MQGDSHELSMAFPCLLLHYLKGEGACTLVPIFLLCWVACFLGVPTAQSSAVHWLKQSVHPEDYGEENVPKGRKMNVFFF